jgi:SAM-dependent methyltransferase
VTAQTNVSWKPVLRPCPGCQSESYRRLGQRGGAARIASLGQETTIVRCRECHLVYQRPVLLPEGNPYESHSPDNYFALHNSDEKIQSGRALAREAAALLGRKGRLLELGCGRGELLLGAQEEGWTVAGVEMTPMFAAANPELPVEVASVEEAQSLDGNQKYDVVLLAAILEHLYDPAACLSRVRHCLADDGLVFIDVPNECSLWSRTGNAYFRLRGRDWATNLSPTFPPFHVVGFCPTSLRRMLLSCGFSVESLRTERWSNALPARRGLLAKLEHLGSSAVLTAGQVLGMGAGITCWARAASEA